MNREFSNQELQNLSEYLDGILSPRERIQFEETLRSKPELQDELEALRRTRLMLRQLPKKRAPRNFFITPEMVPQRQPRRLFPVFRLATALAGILLVFVFAGDLWFGAALQTAATTLGPLAAKPQTSATYEQQQANPPIIVWGSPTPGAYGLGGAPLGMGGGGGGDSSSAAAIASQPQTPQPTVPASTAPDRLVPEGTPAMGGGATTQNNLSAESSTPPDTKAAPQATESAASQEQSLSAVQPSGGEQDQYQSGPILGVNPTQGAADATALKNPPRQPFEVTHFDFHIAEGALALIAILAGLAAVYFHRRESL